MDVVRMVCMCIVFGFWRWGGVPPPLCSLFVGFCPIIGFFGLMSLSNSNDIVILHINLYVFGSCVWDKGESDRTRKD